MLLLIPPTGAVAGSILLPTSLQQLTTWLEDPVGVCWEARVSWGCGKLWEGLHFRLCITFTCCLPSALWGGQLCRLIHFSLCFSFMFTLPYLRKAYNPFSNRKRYCERAPPDLSGRLGSFVLCPSPPANCASVAGENEAKSIALFSAAFSRRVGSGLSGFGVSEPPFCIALQKKGDVGHAWPCSVLPGDRGQCFRVSHGSPAALICLREGKDAE